MTWKLVVTRPAEKELNKVPDKDLKHIRKALIQMTEDPFSGDVVYLKSMGDSVRRRVGSWRIIFDVDVELKIVFVTSIRRRTSTTY